MNLTRIEKEDKIEKGNNKEDKKENKNFFMEKIRSNPEIGKEKKNFFSKVTDRIESFTAGLKGEVKIKKIREEIEKIRGENFEEELKLVAEDLRAYLQICEKKLRQTDRR